MGHAASAVPDSPIDIAIERIGSAGDGVTAASGGRSLHVARTLPGEHVRVQPHAGRSGGNEPSRATLLELLSSSAQRVSPPCPHFLQGCGGCALQHWDDAAYAGWKRGLVVAALERAGFPDPLVGELRRTPGSSRRRMDFAVQRIDGGMLLGLHQAHGMQVVDLRVCAVLDPALFALVTRLRPVLSSLAALRRTGSVLANLLDSGADLLIRTDGPLTSTDRTKLAAFADTNGVPRLSWALGNGPAETACRAGTPTVTFAGTRVEPPPGAFLQASREGEAAIVGAVIAALPDRLTNRSRAVELYAGCGTISFPLARHLRVQAYEGDAGAAAAVRRAQSGSRVEMTQRDLARQPLSAKELAGAAVIVLDPPYAGAAPQMAEIARSGVKRVVYVSCNPGALGRDAALLAGAGFDLLAATPIDQFLWSAQVECVAVFGRR